MKTPLAIIASLVALLVITGTALAQSDVLVNTGSPPSPFSQNKQNEPWVAVNPVAPHVLAAGANDNIDMEACNAGDPTTCPFTEGVGVSGIYFSLDGGHTWIQPVYSGYSARGCLGPEPCTPDPAGPIGTLPWYYESRLVSDGDPSLAFGPRQGTDGRFSWENGVRLYYANLVSNFGVQRDDLVFKGPEGIAVSRTDDVAAAAAGDKNAWKVPVVISKQSAATFSDKEALTVDNAASSPYFGNVYVCNVAFRSNGVGGAPEPVVVVRSTDGGETWSQQQISNAANTNGSQGRSGGRQGCVVRTDSRGTVNIIWRGSFKGQDVAWLARSFDGGVSYDKPRVVAVTGTVGAFDPVSGRYTIDGIAGARTSEGPTLDIANGAPTGAGAPDTIVIGWGDGQNGLNHERAMVAYSNDRGETFSGPFDATEAGDRPNFPWIAISPDGQDVYLVYNGFLDPWRTNTTEPRRMLGVVRYATISSLDSWTTLHRGAVGDAHGSSANSLVAEFLGDYNLVVATNDAAVAVWNDSRDAAVCEAINAYRAGVANVGPAVPRPAPPLDCPATFGNTDIYSAVFGDPTP